MEGCRGRKKKLRGGKEELRERGDEGGRERGEVEGCRGRKKLRGGKEGLGRGEVREGEKGRYGR